MLARVLSALMAKSEPVFSEIDCGEQGVKVALGCLFFMNFFDIR